MLCSSTAFDGGHRACLWVIGSRLDFQWHSLFEKRVLVWLERKVETVAVR